MMCRIREITLFSTRLLEIDRLPVYFLFFCFVRYIQNSYSPNVAVNLSVDTSSLWIINIAFILNHTMEKAY
jgi:hypothetical protein